VRIDSAGGRVQRAAGLSQAARHSRPGQPCEIADRADAPALQGGGEIHLRRQAGERQRRQEGSLLPVRDDDRRLGKPRGDPRGELARSDPGPRRQARGLRGREQGARQLYLGGTRRSCRPAALDAVDVQIDHSLGGVLDAWREALGHLDQRLLRRPLALFVAGAGHQLGDERPRLRQGEARPHPGGTRQPRGGDDTGGAAIAFDDGQRLTGQLRLAAQPGSQGKETDREAGDPGRHGAAASPPAGRRPPLTTPPHSRVGTRRIQ
jgi:hypothetical protein